MAQAFTDYYTTVVDQACQGIIFLCAPVQLRESEQPFLQQTLYPGRGSRTCIQLLVTVDSNTMYMHHYTVTYTLYSGRKPWTIYSPWFRSDFFALINAQTGRYYIQNSNLCHYAPLEVPFPITSLFDGIKIFRFRPKTMDDSTRFLSNFFVRS